LAKKLYTNAVTFSAAAFIIPFPLFHALYRHFTREKFYNTVLVVVAPKKKKVLMIDPESNNSLYEDVLKLIHIRRTSI